MSAPILFVSPIHPCTGNNTTAYRICKGLQTKGYTVLLYSCNDQHQLDEFKQRVKNKQYSHILLLHAFHSGVHILQFLPTCSSICSCISYHGSSSPVIHSAADQTECMSSARCCSNIPSYSVILGGTDMNAMLVDVDKHNVIKRVVQYAKSIVCFTSSLRSQLLTLLKPPFLHYYPHTHASTFTTTTSTAAALCSHHTPSSTHNVTPTVHPVPPTTNSNMCSSSFLSHLLAPPSSLCFSYQPCCNDDDHDMSLQQSTHPIVPKLIMIVPQAVDMDVSNSSSCNSSHNNTCYNNSNCDNNNDKANNNHLLSSSPFTHIPPSIACMLPASSTHHPPTLRCSCTRTFCIRRYAGYRCDDWIFLLPASIRTVKQPYFLTSFFNRWYTINPRIHLLLLGPVLDEDMLRIFPLPLSIDYVGVTYLGCLDTRYLADVYREVTCVINTSMSEGMCGALLEAMTLKVPILARRNDGNAAWIVDEEEEEERRTEATTNNTTRTAQEDRGRVAAANGFLFSDEEEFERKAKLILSQWTTRSSDMSEQVQLYDQSIYHAHDNETPSSCNGSIHVPAVSSSASTNTPTFTNSSVVSVVSTAYHQSHTYHTLSFEADAYDFMIRSVKHLSDNCTTHCHT